MWWEPEARTDIYSSMFEHVTEAQGFILEHGLEVPQQDHVVGSGRDHEKTSLLPAGWKTCSEMAMHRRRMSQATNRDIPLIVPLFMGAKNCEKS